MTRLEAVKAEAKVGDIWVPVVQAKAELEKLLNTPWFAPAMRSAYAPGQRLLAALSKCGDRTDWDAQLTMYEAYEITNPLSEFLTVLMAELAIADTYFVSRKAAYDTYTLISNAEMIFSVDLVIKAPTAIPDLREAGKCLAFELPTAAGFHVLRGTETVVRAYWDAVAGGGKPPSQKNLGTYLAAMERHNIGNPKVRACLKQIKDLHRNPLIHPEETLSLEDAIGLVGICASAISAMLKEIPQVQALQLPGPAP